MQAYACRMKLPRRIILALAAPAALTAAVAVPAASPASTAVPRITPPAMNIHENETSHPYSIGASSLTTQTHIKETSTGRTLDLISANDGIGNDYKLRFNADTSKCIGLNLSNNFNFDVKSCSGDAIVFGWDPTGTGSNHRWQNKYAENHGLGIVCITGSGTGTNYVAIDCGPGGGVQVFETGS